MKKRLSVTLLSVAAVSLLHAGALSPIKSETSDQEVFGNGGMRWFGQTDARIGNSLETDDGNVLILVFALPTLSQGESISKASLSAFISGINGPYNFDPSWSLDLYGLRTSNSNIVLATDFFMGANDSHHTKVQDDFSLMAAGLADTTISSSASGETALGSWLATQYTDENPNAAYAFLRLNADIDEINLPQSRYYKINTGDDESNPPTLTITADVDIPESSSFALLIGLTGLGVVARRRRC